MLLIDLSPPQPMRALPYSLAAREERAQAGDSVDSTLEMLFARAADAAPRVRLAHQGEVLAAAFSPDGSRVVTASDDRTARVWDARTGKPLTEPLAHQGTVRAAAFSPDGARVVTASDDKTARVWDARTGKPAHQAPRASRQGPSGGVQPRRRARGHRERRQDRAGVGRDGPARRSPSPSLHQGEVRAAAFSPDGARVVTASADGTARVWDARTGKPLTEPLVLQGQVRAAAFSLTARAWSP